MNLEPDFIKDAEGAIFDLDGVIVDTAKYHYVAWKRLADELRFEFTEAHNERLKGVSRVRSLEILLEIGGFDFGETLKQQMLTLKNGWYLEYIHQMTGEEILPGTRQYIEMLKSRGVRIALGSASKNAQTILNRLGIEDLFDVVIDGTSVSEAKPSPEVFIRGAEGLKLSPERCVVFEDASSGVEAAHRAQMRAIGIGSKENLPDADCNVSGLYELLSGSPTIN
ncbi:beta-phosphoglucomutase [Coraliomargarita parva]|uniref:beta-phosphoglucomutase n=1 Tax=Coraliomargarita parva TaxID=3014050 RepID=UPI0022B42646|nr:beta-phosphoglucomutase [Coraliomargarita parva]